jgi:hypothetical protein
VPRNFLVLIGVNAALLAGVLMAVLALEGGEDDALRPAAATTATTRVDRFDSARAWAELRRQVALGPRPAGSRTLRGLAERLRRELPNGRFERVPGHPRLRNVTGRLPGRRPAIVLAAHYDTKAIPGLVGANDGASGTAVVMGLARALRHAPRPAGAPELRFVLFDGEEATDDSKPFEATGLRGSRAYAARHRGEIGAVILLDFVGGKQLRIRREAFSDRALWSRLVAAARTVGAGRAFSAASSGGVVDDHVPFVRQGVPAINLIEWPYACWHKRCDDLSAVEERSLDLTGETVVELVRTLSK